MPAKPWLLIALVTIELTVFSVGAPHFLSLSNAGDLLRLSAELGLLALALTCVIVSGGIDLSVGSLLGLSAILFGWMHQELGWPMALCLTATLGVGALGGYLNGFLITRFRALPLIITLGTYSLFRGIAEGLTGGAKNYTNFPAFFLSFGQYAPVFVLAAAALTYYFLLHRSIFGRGFYAIGNSASAARYSGLPVDRWLTGLYTLAGLTAAVAGILYVARVGQAKADAGTGYELLAITAVVLGGTSIFGGSGSIFRTILGLFSIALLQNGLRLMGQPVELAGLLTGFVLLLVLAADQRSAVSWSPRRRIVLAAALTAIALFGMVSLRRSSAVATKRITVGMMPKQKGDPYFISCKKGADEAAKEFGVDLLWDGPADLDPARQNEIVESWITRRVDAIAVSVENRGALSAALRKARSQGIKVLTWDADAEPDARDFFINQATAQGIGTALADQAAQAMDNTGTYAIVTSSLTAANQNEWINFIRQRMAEKYPHISLATTRPSDGDRDRAFAETQTILRVYPQVKLVMGVAAPAVPGAAEAVKQSGRTDVAVVGLSLPNLCRPYLLDGVIRSIVLWNTVDLGYLTVRAAQAAAAGDLKSGATQLPAGRLGTLQVNGDQVMLGAPFVFTRHNVADFDF